MGLSSLPTTTPRVVVIAGPNGAGKSTLAATLVQRIEGVSTFVNADVIARGLSVLSPERVAVSAGKIMLRRLDELEHTRQSFAFETTLATKSFATRLARLDQSGVETVLYFICLRSAELAMARVVQRVAAGGHSIPEEDVRRRFDRGLSNLHHVYRPIVSRWVVYDNSDATGLRLVASGARSQVDVVDRRIWAILQRSTGLQK